MLLVVPVVVEELEDEELEEELVDVPPHPTK
jgi:hypothetical protein